MPTPDASLKCNTHPEGGGCALPRAPRRCVEESPKAACTDSNCGVDTGERAEAHLVGGAGAGCVHAPATPGTWMFALILLWWGRRRGRLAALLLALWIPRAEAVDVEAYEPLDGSPIPGLVDPALGPKWAPRVNLGATTSIVPVRLRAGPDSEIVVQQLQTLETGVSLQLADWMVVGFDLPVHNTIPEEGPSGSRIGDPTTFVRIPVKAHGAGADGFEARMQTPRNPGRDPSALPNPSVPWTRTASVSMGWVSSRAFPRTCSGDGEIAAGYSCPWWLGARVAARIQPKAGLPGLTWTSRWEGSFGIRRNLGIFGLSGALLGSAPLQMFSDPTGAWPLEWLGSGSVRMGSTIVLHLGAGSGLSRGLGAPAGRVFANLAWTGGIGDRDLDGYLDPRDFCPNKPEDRDHFRDGDGCPEPDNDRDGLLDPVDDCPLVAEVHNGWRDEDGCPDELAEWTVAIWAPEPLEQVWVEVDGQGAWQVASSFHYELLPGEHTLFVQAPGHVPVRQALRLSEGENETDVRLLPVVMSAAVIALVSADTELPLAGTVVIEGEAYEVPEGGVPLPLRVGRHALEARAPGHLVENAQITVPRGTPGRATVALDRIPALSAPQIVLFELGSAELKAEVELIDTLATWLLAHPQIRLLRIEGHADEIGNSAFNLDLSVRRAEAVARALVDRGVARTRLDPIGSGESRTWLSLHGLPPGVETTVAGEALREVAFQVLVWDEVPLPTASR